MSFQNMETVAAERGYPARLFGYGPQEGAYWVEPALRWVSELISSGQKTPNAEQAAELARLYTPGLMTDNRMAPRFRRGTGVAGPLAGADYRPAVGDVLSWWVEGQHMLARVLAVQPTGLLLGFDNDGETFGLPWPFLPEWHVLHVTYYTRLPYPGYDGD